MTDANDNLFSNDSLLPQFLSECNLTSLIFNPQHTFSENQESETRNKLTIF
jgi:hypothetical protein